MTDRPAVALWLGLCCDCGCAVAVLWLYRDCAVVRFGPSGDGPRVMADLEMGVYRGTRTYDSINATFVTVRGTGGARVCVWPTRQLRATMLAAMAVQ